MTEFIDREAVIAEQKRFGGYLDDDMLFRLELAVRRIPAADVRENRHGTWETREEKSDGLIFRVGVCSACGKTKPMKIFSRESYAFNYCPNCGADMRGDADV